MVTRNGAAAAAAASRTSRSGCPQTMTVDCLPGDIIIVVNTAGWSCKSCNVTETFGNGKSIENHLQTHQIFPGTGHEGQNTFVQGEGDRHASVKETAQKRRDAPTELLEHVDIASRNKHLSSPESHSKVQASTSSPTKTRLAASNKLAVNSSDSSLEILGPRQRKRTAKVLESEAQSLNSLKRVKTVKSSKRSEREPSSVANVVCRPVEIARAAPAKHAHKTVKVNKRLVIASQRKKIPQRKFTTSTKLKQKYKLKPNAKSKKSISVSDLKELYMMTLDSEVQVKKVEGVQNVDGVGNSEISELDTRTEHTSQTQTTESRSVSNTDQKQESKGEINATMVSASSDAMPLFTGFTDQNSSMSNTSNTASSTLSSAVSSTHGETSGTTSKSDAVSGQVMQRLRNLLTASQSATGYQASDGVAQGGKLTTGGSLGTSTSSSQALSVGVTLHPQVPLASAFTTPVMQMSDNGAALHQPSPVVSFGTTFQETANSYSTALPHTDSSDTHSVIMSDTSMTSSYQVCNDLVPAGSFTTIPVSISNCTIPTEVPCITSSTTTLTSPAPKPSLSFVTQDDAQTLELVSGALKELQDNLLAKPPPSTSTTQQTSDQENKIQVSDLVLTESCPPMQQFEQHVARMVQQNETPDISVDVSVQFASHDHQYEQTLWHRAQPSAKSSAIASDCTAQGQLAEETPFAEAQHSQTPDLASQQNSEAMVAERADHLTNTLPDITQEKKLITEEDVDKLLMPKKGQHICQFCRHVFTTAESLQEHVHRYASQQPVQCKVCSLKLHCLDLLNVHIYYKHEADSPAKSCFTCGKTFGRQRTLVQHIVNGHAGMTRHTFQSLLADSRGVHECTICKKMLLDSQRNVDRHYKLHKDSGKQHECPACGKRFLFRYLLLSHMEKNSKNDDPVHQAEFLKIQTFTGDGFMGDRKPSERKPRTTGKYHCNFCDKYVWNVRQVVRRHLMVHARKYLTKVASENYHCSICGKDVKDFADNITDHFKTHGHVPIKCKYCGKVFSSYGNCYRHEKNVHEGNSASKTSSENATSKKSMCEVCGKMMYSKYTLQKHLKLHGEIKSLYSCDQCPRSFHYQSQLERHRAKHSGASGNAMTCQHCGKHYMHKKSLDRHIQVDHMGVKDYPYKCDQCPAQFFDSVQLRDHVAFRHQNLRRYKCRLCAESFVCRPTMARHMRRDHDGYSPYICKVCGEKFVEKMQLLKHQVVHTGVEPFQCTVCSKTFTRPRSLKLHMNLHNGIRPFACEGCGKAYVKKSHLERHRKKCKTLAADPSPDLIPKPDTSDSEQHQKKNQSPKRDNGPCTDPDSKPGLNLTLHHNANLDANLNRNPNHSPDHKLHLNMNPAPSSLLNPVGQTVIVLPPGSQIL